MDFYRADGRDRTLDQVEGKLCDLGLIHPPIFSPVPGVRIELTTLAL